MKSRTVADRRGRSECPHGFEKNEHGRRYDCRQNERQSNTERAARGRSTRHLRGLLIGRVHVVEGCRNRKEDQRVKAERQNEDQTAPAIDVENGADTESVAEQNIDQPGIGSKQQDPRNHGDEVRNHKSNQDRDAHEGAPRHLGSCHAPSHRQGEYERVGRDRNADDE